MDETSQTIPGEVAPIDPWLRQALADKEFESEIDPWE